MSGNASSNLTRTRTASETWNSPAPEDFLVPGLTVIYHPDLSRVGERTVLAGLERERTCRLARHTPEFAHPGTTGASRPLDDPRLSRTAILLEGRNGRLIVDRGDSRTRLKVVDTGAVTRTVAQSFELDIAALEEGVVLVLGGRVVLLLHLLDPVAPDTTPAFGLVGESPTLRSLRRDILQTADLDTPILLRGESGTGKELVARAIHESGPRRRQPYIALNMAAVPPNLAAAELFGAARGAYTGASQRRAGHFARAHGGTLFLDEIGETPPEIQVLLLRALETREIQPVGSEKTERVDVRVISATDADLESAIDSDRFRAPLLHRLSGYVIRLPALRIRREDFGRLFVFFLRRELEAVGALHLFQQRSKPWIPAALVARLAAWHWPGNVRQLANVVRQLVIANRGSDPASRFDEVEALLASTDRGAKPGKAAAEPPQPLGRRRPSDLREEEVVAALRAHRFRPSPAADALGIPRSSIYDLIKKISGLRQASDLGREEIARAVARFGPSLEAVAANLEVSESALRRRLRELDLTVPS
ncbi:MAG: sigma-54 dependent transcriptional regulator [Acidobacteriota bacterium]